MDGRAPFGMTALFLLTVSFDADSETLTGHGVEPQTLLALGLVVVNKAGDVMLRHNDDMIGGLRDELPVEDSTPFQPGKAMLGNLPLLPDSLTQISREIRTTDETEAGPQVLVDEPANSYTVHDDLDAINAMFL